MAARKFLTDIEVDGYFDLKGNAAKKFRLEDYADNTAPTSNFVGRMIYTTSGTDRVQVYTDGGWKSLAFVDELLSGTVTSVGLSLPSIFNVSNSPVTSSGTLTATLASQSANTIFAGPSTGGNAAPTFRSLTTTDIPDLSGTYLTSESDPIFTASDAYGITATDITNWETAYGWGDHGAVGYLTGETDPVFSASDVAGVTTTDINNWDAAYSWGDHSLVGYATLSGIETLTNKTISDTLYFTNTGNTNSIYADGNDLTIYGHNNVYINTNNADINLQPDGYAKIWGSIIATQDYVTGLGYLTTAVESISNTDGNISFSSSTGAVTADLATNIEIAGDLTVQGDLTVNGDITTLNTTTLAVEDNLVVLNSNVTGTPSVNAGLEVERGTYGNATLFWNETSNSWFVGTPADDSNAAVEKAIARKYATTINTTATTAYTVTHNLGTQDVIIQTYSGGSMVDCDIDITADNTITITTNTSETGLKVVVIG